MKQHSCGPATFIAAGIQWLVDMHAGAATEHLPQQAQCSASGPTSEADGNGHFRDHDPRRQQWQNEAADEAMELCAKCAAASAAQLSTFIMLVLIGCESTRHKLATVEAHACVQDAFQALHGNFHKAAQKALEGLAHTQRDVPWNQDDESAFHAAIVQVVNRWDWSWCLRADIFAAWPRL